MSSLPRRTQVQRLRRTRPKSRLVRFTVWSLLSLCVLSWASGEISLGGSAGVDRALNLKRFLTQEAVPFPLRADGFSWGGLFDWVGGIWNSEGRRGTLATLWIAVSAIVLASLFGILIAPLMARTLATRDPYLLGSTARQGPGWWAVTSLARFFCVLLRAIPEYVWAFFLIAMLPGSAWPAVLALAVHNAGILGRLYGDTMENLEAAPLRSLRMLGAERRQIFLLAAVPLGLPRMLLYFFYRFETCVREATVLGMLGVVSLGYYVKEARSRHFYDEMLLLVAFGGGIVLLADLLSYLVRGWVRRAR